MDLSLNPNFCLAISYSACHSCVCVHAPSDFVQVVKLGNSAVVQALLVAGADPNLPDPDCGLTVMHDAAREGFIDSVLVLVDHGADANLVDGRGNLPLHLAAREGHLEVVRLLIGRTANPQKRNCLGHTAYRLALLHERMDTVEYMDEYFSSRE